MTDYQTAREALLSLPAQSPPKGVVPNFENPPNIYILARGIQIFGIIIATLLVGAKLYAQLRITRRMFLEDWLLSLAWVVYAGAYIPICLFIAKLPLGIHQWNTRLGKFIEHIFFYYCGVIIFCIITLLLKLVMLLQILRLFVPPGVRTSTFWITHIMIWLNICFYIAFIFLEMFCCTPRQKFWDHTIQGGHCMDFLLLHLAGTTICLISDVSILLLPQRVIAGLKMRFSKKIGLALIFATGLFGCACSAARLYYHIVLVRERTDYTYTLARAGLWATIQVISGFIIAGVPALPKLFAHFRIQPWGVQVETSLKSWLNVNTPRISRFTSRVTIGGGGVQKKQRDKSSLTTDREFDELVLKSALSGV